MVTLNLVKGGLKFDAILLYGISMVLKTDCIPIRLKSGMEVFVNPLPICLPQSLIANNRITTNILSGHAQLDVLLMSVVG